MLIDLEKSSCWDKMVLLSWTYISKKRTELSTIWARDLEYSFQVFVDNDALSSKLNINEEQCELLGAGLPSM